MRLAVLTMWLGLLATHAAAAGLVNLSARGVTGPGADALTAGFVIGGTSPKRVLIRGAGPALAEAGFTTALAEPRLDLFSDGSLIATNAGWSSSPDAAEITRAALAVGAFAFLPNSRDTALLLTLAPGAYTAQVVSANSARTTGEVLIEIYDLEPENGSRLANLSARARVGRDETFIAGFVVGATGRNRILVRGIGPALAGFGVTDALADPRLELFRGQTSIGFNDHWRANTTAAQLARIARNAGAFALGENARDAALLLGGAAGPYTAHVTGSGGESGVALIEVYDTAGAYELPPPRTFDLVGFGRVPGHGLATVSGGGMPATLYNPATRTGDFWRIDDATIAAAGTDFGTQLQAALSSDQPLVIELNTMIDLSRFGRPNTGGPAIAHPDLFAAGRTTGTVGTLAVGSNKTLYSAYGNGGFRRGTLTIGGRSNIILRNLMFRELWEWDDATSGEYDRNGWDYLVLSGNTSGPTVTAHAHHIWIDHCDFEEAYDGLFDIVHGADLISVSWTRLAGAVSGESARWVQRQMDHLEANRSSFPYYNAQRATLSLQELVRREAFQKKSNLVGNSADTITAAHDTGFLNLTFHHNWYLSVDQRMPRMRFGNAHVFNLLADSTAGRNVNGLTLAGVAATSNGAVRVDNSRFIDVRTATANRIGTESTGLVTVVNSVNFDTVTGTNKGFDPISTVPIERFLWNVPAARSAIANWPLADSSVMPAGYTPAGRALSEYLDSNDYLASHLEQVGIIVPADEAEAEQLRRYLQSVTAPR